MIPPPFPFRYKPCFTKRAKGKTSGLGEEPLASQRRVDVFDSGCVFRSVSAPVRSSAASAFATLDVLPETHRLRGCSEAEEGQSGAGVSEARLFSCGVGVRGGARASLCP